MEYLIPPEWFAGLHWALLLGLAAIALFGLVRGADWLVEGAGGIALRAGLSKIIVGATIVSLGTTSPECAVSVMAAWSGEPGLALGNAVGSIIADTGLIFGVGCLLIALPVDTFIVRRQGWVQFGAGAGLALACYLKWGLHGDQAMIGLTVGTILLVALAWYIRASIRWGREHAGLYQASMRQDPSLEHAEHESWPLLAIKFLIGLTMVVVFSHVLIECVKELALQWGIPKVVIASTIVAFGTSLPELVVGITAIRKNHAELLIGNVIGADVLNVLFVIGASASVAPLPLLESPAEAPLPEIFLLLHLPTMLLILTMFRVFIRFAVREGRFRRWFGVPLLTVYIGYLVLNFLLSRG